MSGDPEQEYFSDGITEDIITDLSKVSGLFRPYCNSGVMDGRVFKRRHLARLAEGGYSCVLFNALTGDGMDRDGWRSFSICYRKNGHEIVQRLDPACMPMRRGEIRQSMDHLTN
jgi:hypothetical protein